MMEMSFPFCIFAIMYKKKIIKKKLPIVRKVRKSRTPKTRNSGTFTDAMFWNFIRASLRQRSRWWKPILECRKKSRRPYVGPLKRQKFEVQCNKCKNYFPDKQISVDHVIPLGELRCKEDLPGFVERLFVEVDDLQCLCSTCHLSKTASEKQFRKNKRILDNFKEDGTITIPVVSKMPRRKKFQPKNNGVSKM